MPREDLILLRRGSPAALAALTAGNYPEFMEPFIVIDGATRSLYVGEGPDDEPSMVGSGDVSTGPTTASLGKNTTVDAFSTAAGAYATATGAPGDIFGGGTAFGYAAFTDNGGSAFGYKADATGRGVAFGALTDAYNNGSAFGYGATARNLGTAMGQLAHAEGGVGVGYQANGDDQGVALGPEASAPLSGVAVGTAAVAGDKGSAVGRASVATEWGCAFGYASTGIDYGLALGNRASTTGIPNRTEIAPMDETGSLRARISGHTTNKAWQFTAPQSNTAPTTAAADTFGNADGTLPQGMIQLQVNAAGTAFVVYANIAGTIKTGTLAIA